MRKIVLTLGLAVALASCSSEPAPKVTDQQTEEASPAPTPSADPSALPPEYLSSDCKAVMTEYANFLRERDYRHAAMAWSDPTVTSDALALRFEEYGSPDLTIGETNQEGAAGTLYCEVTVTLRDADALQRPLKQGTVTLKRVNDVPGATADQLRWRIASSTLAEKPVDQPSATPGDGASPDAAKGKDAAGKAAKAKGA